jgi:HAD superfamily hydrolase (TIGR01509 family)
LFILFDFDGVLVDSMPVWAGVHINMLKEFGVPVPEDFVKTITPLGNLKASEYTISLGADISLEDYLSRQHTVLSYEYGERIVLKDTVKETLETLKAQGHSLNVLTASPHRYVDPCLKRNGIYGLFDNVWTIDDFGLTKDNVKIYRDAASRLGANEEECVFFDDNVTAIKTAAASGMRTVGVYDATSEALKEEIKSSCDLYIHRFSELFK